MVDPLIHLLLKLSIFFGLLMDYVMDCLIELYLKLATHLIDGAHQISSI